MFDTLAGCRSSFTISSSKFSKLSKLKGLVSEQVMKAHYDIIYKNALTKTGVGLMTLDVFYDALEILAQKLFPYEIDKIDAIIARITEQLPDLKAPSVK